MSAAGGAGAERSTSGREARLRALRAAFLAEAGEDCAELRRLCAAASPGAPAGDDARRARKLAHDLRGSGGSYGYPEVSAAAALLEESLRAVAPAGARLAAEVRALAEAVARARSDA